MRPIKLATLALFIALVAACSNGPAQPDEPAEATKTQTAPTFDYPETERQDVVNEIFGQTVRDPYRWLEDVEDEKVQTWMEKQDGYARNYLQELPGRDTLAKRFEELFYVDALYAPSVRGGRYFYRRRHADKEKAVYYWKESADAEEQVLLDPNTMSEDGSLSIGGVFVAWDGKKVAYKAQENNADEATLYIMDVDTGKVSDVDVIKGAKYAYPSWTPDSKGFYYTNLPTDSSIPVDERPGHAEVRFHELGTKQAQDKLVREKTGDPRSFLGVDLSRDGRWLLGYVWHGWDRSDVYYQDLKADKPEWKPLVTGTEYSYEVHVLSLIHI